MESGADDWRGGDMLGRRGGVEPEQIPGYHGLERIGSGGSSVVYRAWQEQLHRPVAVKVLGMDARDDAAVRRFLRECQLVSRLAGHPHVVTVLDTGRTASGRPYIAMELFENGSLREQLAARGPLPVDEVLRTGVKLAGALAAAHEAGVLHCDIKPENVLVSRYGEPALADFGVARGSAALGGSTSTRALTPHHAAPEVLDGRPASPASDVYSLGSTLYQLLAGRPAFQPAEGEGIAPMLLRILREQPPPLSRTDVPAPVLAVIGRGMAKDPAQRYPDARTMGTALQAAQAEAGYPVTELPTAVPPVPTPSTVDSLPGESTADGRAAALTMLRQGRQLPPAADPATPGPRWSRRVLIGAAAVLLLAGALVGLRVALARSQPAAARVSDTSPSTAATVLAAAPPSAASAAPASASPTAGSRGTSPTTRRPAPPPAAGGRVTPKLLGAPDFNGYCQATGQGAVTLIAANKAYGWHCSADNGTGDNAQAVCQWTYHTTKIANRVANFNDPNSWQCWRSNGKLGGLDFNQYCVDLGYSGAYSVANLNAYGWFCTGSTKGIDTQAACQQLYGSSPPISRFQDFFNRNSWECWG